jgi:hypothetical protein
MNFKTDILRNIVHALCSFVNFVSRDILLQVFFHDSSFPRPWKMTLGWHPNFLCKFAYRDNHKSRCTTGINDTGGKLAALDNYTSGRFAGINDTGSKFATCTAPLMVTLAVNLPLVSMTPVAKY